MSASYDVNTTTAQEDVGSVPNSSFSTAWNCTDDPWIATTLTPICTRQSITQPGPDTWLDFILLAPFSATYLNDSAHAVFVAQLQKATFKLLPVGEATGVANASSGAAILGALGTTPQTPGSNPAPALPDLAVVSISGPATRQVGLSGSYTVTIKNQGGTSAAVEVFVVFTGALDQTGQAGQIVAGAGLSCEVKRDDPGVNASVHCSGGTLSSGQTATIVVQGRGQSAGTGKLVASINPSHAPAEGTYDNNVSKPFVVTIN